MSATRSRFALLGLVAASMACHYRATSANPKTVPEAPEKREGAVQTITSAELANLKVRRVEELLAGRVAGVRVIPTAAGGFMIRIRGVGSLTATTEPLYVIDGMVVHVEKGQGLNWLDPAEIERIDVLKDPAETTMYGVRGANGVILIRTKRRSH